MKRSPIPSAQPQSPRRISLSGNEPLDASYSASELPIGHLSRPTQSPGPETVWSMFTRRFGVIEHKYLVLETGPSMAGLGFDLAFEAL
jgi:hypothetical protein